MVESVVMADKHYPVRITVVTDSAEWVLKYRDSEQARKVCMVLQDHIDGNFGDLKSDYFTDDSGSTVCLRVANIDSFLVETDDG